MLRKQETSTIKYTPRPYQSQAVHTVVDFTKEHIGKGIEASNQDDFSEISVPLEMATGSGKTFTVGKYLD